MLVDRSIEPRRFGRTRSSIPFDSNPPTDRPTRPNGCGDRRETEREKREHAHRSREDTDGETKQNITTRVRASSAVAVACAPPPTTHNK
mmetsp:Transcript_19613/g.45745  ORF Transcript_19613/g.45745 Transcript_19613/m.45745 type:complete len:89 (+) Transcript_19613:966-1232(+)